MDISPLPVRLARHSPACHWPGLSRLRKVRLTRERNECAAHSSSPACLLHCLRPALTHEYPDRPIHLIVPQAAGSATDTLARLFGASLGDALGQQIVVDDRPGGALTVGMDLTAKAPPDGYTLCMAPIGALGADLEHGRSRSL